MEGVAHLVREQDGPVLAAGLSAKDPRTRLAINLLYYTGQRISDVLKMRWSDINGDEMYVFQQKTKKEVYPPIHSALAEVLDATPRLSALGSSSSGYSSAGRWAGDESWARAKPRARTKT